MRSISFIIWHDPATGEPEMWSIMPVDQNNDINDAEFVEFIAELNRQLNRRGGNRGKKINTT